MTCFYIFFVFLGGKLDVGGRDDLFFFGLHLILEGKLDVGRRHFFFFLVFT